MSHPGPRAKVILADNDTLVRGLIRSILISAEHEVFPAADGVEAVAFARQFQAGLVLLDISMPRLNGLLACHEIRALPGYGAVPIVMLTGIEDVRLRESARLLGATDFLTKPFRPDRLLARLAMHLGAPASPAPALERPLGQAWTTPHVSLADRADSKLLEAGRQVLDIWRRADRKL